MGILNVTPDSFSDGGRFLETDRALARAREMIAQGAAIIDVGGESTRPGAEPVSAEEEWRRIGPVVEALVSEGQCLVSVDTYKSVVARQALEAGAHLINDISGLNFDPHMADVVADYQVPLVLMHIQGTPQNMQRNPQYTHLVEEVFEFLFRAVARARAQGIEQLLVDPGIGFGKRWEDNFELIRRIGEFRSLGYPILLGTSRKSFLGRLLDVPPADRLYGNLSVTIFSALQGVRVFRVHDVRPTVEALDTLRAVLEKKIPPAAQEGVS
ncbi:MAG: dihydropteroate synthase [Calditrichaeota bacterium]|nr:MAG: dihydropteroate synthase [Calditrichota bacterium]